MSRVLVVMLLSLFLSACSVFGVHKATIEQGNIISEQSRSLRPGMTETQVKAIMGTPVLVNILTPERVDYIYTIEKGYQPMQKQRITCIFEHGILRRVERA